MLYKDERLRAELGEEGDPTTIDVRLHRLLLRTKFRHWHYEEEIRGFVPLDEAMPEGRLHFYPFDEHLQLAEVILGPQCTLSLDAVRRLTKARYPKAVTYKARLAFNYFKVVPQGLTVP